MRSYIASIILCLIASTAFAADYDRDGRDDLEVIKINRKANNTGSTKWYIRQSSNGKIITSSFSLPGASLFHARRSDKEFYPGIVWIRSISKPLERYLKSSKGTSKFTFGMPGDRLPNQQDIDRDGVTDFTVVRKVGEQLQWFFRLSKSPKETKSITFGNDEDKFFLGPDGMFITVSPDFHWRGRYLSSSALAIDLVFGQAGDIPLAPIVPGQIVIARPGSPATLISRLSNGAVQSVPLGSGSILPILGFFSSKSSMAVGWINPSKGTISLKAASRTVTVKIGDSSMALMLPSGQVFQPGDTGRFNTPNNGGGGNDGGNNGGGNDGGGGGAPPTNPGLASVCPTVRAATGGEIWKSIASTHIPNSDPRRFSTSFITRAGTRAPSSNCLNLYDSKGNLIHMLGKYSPTGSAYSSRNYGGSGCGDKKRASVVAAQAQANTGSIEGYLKVSPSECVRIPNPNSCLNSSAC